MVYIRFTSQPITRYKPDEVWSDDTPDLYLSLDTNQASFLGQYQTERRRSLSRTPPSMADPSTTSATVEQNPQQSEPDNPPIQLDAPPAVTPSPSRTTTSLATPVTVNPNSNSQLMSSVPQPIQQFAPPPISSGGVVLPPAPSFRPAPPPVQMLAPQFSPVPNANLQNSNFQNPNVPPPGVSPVPVMMSYQIPPPGQPPNPALRPYAPVPNGYPAIPAPGPQGAVPPPGGFSSLYLS